MNVYTTIEESKQLIEAGLDVNTADMFWQTSDEPCMWEYTNPHIYVGEKPKLMLEWLYAVPAWSLVALLNIINNNGIPYKLRNNHKSESGYILTVKVINIIGNRVPVNFEKIIDCITWLLEEDYIKSNKNE